MVKTVLKQEELSFKKRKCHVNLDSITFQRKSYRNFKEIRSLRFTLKIPEIIGTSTFTPNSSDSSKIRELKLALNNSLKNPIYSGNKLNYIS